MKSKLLRNYGFQNLSEMNSEHQFWGQNVKSYIYLWNKQVVFWKVIILLLLELTGLKINWKFVSFVLQPSESSFTTRKLRLRRTCFHHVDKEPSFAAHQLRATLDPSHHKAHEKQVDFRPHLLSRLQCIFARKTRCAFFSVNTRIHQGFWVHK